MVLILKFCEKRWVAAIDNRRAHRTGIRAVSCQFEFGVGRSRRWTKNHVSPSALSRSHPLDIYGWDHSDAGRTAWICTWLEYFLESYPVSAAAALPNASPLFSQDLTAP